MASSIAQTMGKCFKSRKKCYVISAVTDLVTQMFGELHQYN
uniref:Uncharacterized protein n=1 Tax=Anguilla anguilla TaxID=7936 RepID=A0A0E9PR06_ANGAN